MDLPVATITKSNDIDCVNFEAQLIPTGGVSYQWYPLTYISNTHIANPVVNPPIDTKYSVVAKNENSCKTKDSVIVQSNTLNANAAKFEIASAFTPNHDGLNDCFSVKYWGPADFFDISIYDRWGHPVYHSNNLNNCWDGTVNGKPQGSGTYVYKITVSSNCSNGLVHKNGTLVLIR
jgi:gliding motility-associated-like protein